jgi:uncharacterized protein YoxC
MSGSDAWQYALALFLIATGAALTYVLLRAGGVLERINLMLDGVNQELVPMLSKANTSLDHVNGELEKVGQITDSAVDATEKVDQTVRAVSDLISKPVAAVAGFSAGVRHGVDSLFTKRGQRGGVV